MRLFYRPWLSYRDRGALVLLVWKPVAVFSAIAVLAWLLHEPPARVLVSAIVAGVAWVIIEGIVARHIR